MDHRIKKHPLGFFEIVNKPSVDELRKYYAEKYFQNAQSTYELEYTKEELKFFQGKLIQRYFLLKQLRESHHEAGESFLDVGCGEGYAMAFFRKKGFSIKGIDFSSAGVESKNPNCIDALITGDVFELLETEIDSGKQYDVVWLQNVLEHVLDSVVLMQTLRKLIAPRGIAVITVPNDCSNIQIEALEKRFIDRPFWICPPDHISYFDYKSLTNIAKNTCWEVVDIIADFPIDWYLFHSGSNYVMDVKAGKLAYNAKIQIENLLAEQSVDDVVDLWRSLAKVGAGRNLTAFIIPSTAS